MTLELTAEETQFLKEVLIDYSDYFEIEDDHEEELMKNIQIKLNV